ncbi:MAG: GntR family transcriptional regulator [Anaerolineales bacterium]|nr:GntR family transcriptional regulator [Anaerolineales bacterium]MDW8446913.1 GntR family transcriptional regulator [Anaerolineales bacterium]
MSSILTTEGVPLYVKIREGIRSDILQGRLQPGQKIPSEEELAEQYRVSRMTVRQGILDLIKEGLLHRKRGVGTFVSYPHFDRDHTRLTNFFESAREQGIEASSVVLKIEILAAPEKVAKHLRLEPGGSVICIRTLRYVNHTPVTVHDSFLPHRLFAGIIHEGLENVHLWDVMEKYGFQVKRALQKLEAKPAAGEIAKLLGVKPGYPILYKERTVFSTDGTPVEFTYCYNRGDMYSLTVAMER